MKSIKIILSLIIFLTTSFSYATSAPSENIRCGQEAYCSTAQVIADFNFLKSKNPMASRKAAASILREAP